MENAVKALEYAFAVLVFGIALTTSIYLFSKAKSTSDTVFGQIDTRQFYTPVQLPPDEFNSDGSLANGRTVNVETIIPTLYRAYKENYVVEFWQGEPPEAGTSNDGKCIIRFDLSAESVSKQIWMGTSNVDYKKRFDLFLQGSINYKNNSFINSHDYKDIAQNDPAFQSDIDSSTKDYIITKGLYKYLTDVQNPQNNGKIIEEFGYVSAIPDGKITEDISRIVIRYVII
ncbi:MAG: hypothetical protein FWF46_00265 [Oscillospiraceae bacterium]|nr:hypothetical protein [Oscillospiraceae bacterium]